jgi:hypothetical protein
MCQNTDKTKSGFHFISAYFQSIAAFFVIGAYGSVMSLKLLFRGTNEPIYSPQNSITVEPFSRLSVFTLYVFIISAIMIIIINQRFYLCPSLISHAGNSYSA